MDDQGPSAELGLYPPELNPTAPETAVADNAMDTDTDVTARQRYFKSSILYGHNSLLRFGVVKQLCLP